MAGRLKLSLMSKPNKTEVARYFFHQISQLNGLPEIDFLQSDILVKQPFCFDSIGLANLALTIGVICKESRF